MVLHTPVSLNLGGENFVRLTVTYLFAAIPFFFTGLLFSTVFAREPHRIGNFYGADLLGGAAACLAVVPLLNLIGGANAILFSALAMAAAARCVRGLRGSSASAQSIASRASRKRRVRAMYVAQSRPLSATIQT